MSQSIIEKFIVETKDNEELQNELKAMDNDIEKITQFANSKGYDFTVSDLKSFMDTQKSGLSDDQLDKVAGGIHFNNFVECNILRN